MSTPKTDDDFIKEAADDLEVWLNDRLDQGEEERSLEPHRLGC